MNVKDLEQQIKLAAEAYYTGKQLLMTDAQFDALVTRRNFLCWP